VVPSVREGAQKMTRCISSLLIIIKIKDIDTHAACSNVRWVPSKEA